jgi:predicted nucleic acid-binding protein
MRVIVAHANLLAYLVWPGDHTADAEAVFAHDQVWMVPPSWISELRGIVARYVRRGDATVNDALAALERAEAVIDCHENPVSSRVVLELSVRSGCSTNDCEYVALAAALGVRLVTFDRDVLRAFPDIAIAPKEYEGPC